MVGGGFGGGGFVPRRDSKGRFASGGGKSAPSAGEDVPVAPPAAGDGGEGGSLEDAAARFQAAQKERTQAERDQVELILREDVAKRTGTTPDRVHFSGAAMDEMVESRPGNVTGVQVQCYLCKKKNVLMVTDGENAARAAGALAQEAYPTLKPPARELLIGRTCPQCWQEMYGDGPQFD